MNRINYVQTFTLTNGGTRDISLPDGDNVRLIISSSNNTGLALRQIDAVVGSSNAFYFGFNRESQPIIINPPFLCNGETITVFEASGAGSVQVSYWLTSGV